LIGHPLDAAVTLGAPADLMELMHGHSDELRSVFIVSKAILSEGPFATEAYRSQAVKGLTVQVERCEDPKCARCWIHDPAVGSFSDQPQVCGRCRQAVAEIPLTP
jgi:isoleucyl-tRNA synthetase